MASTDAMPVPKKNTAFRYYFAIRDNTGALVTSWAGQDSEVSKDGGSFTDCTNEATEIGSSGCGYIDLTATEMNADSVVLKVTVTNTDALAVVVTFFPEEAGDLRVNASQFGGQTVTAAAGVTVNAEIGASSTAMDNFEDAFDGTGYDLGGIDVSELNGVIDDLLNGGRLDLLIDAIKAKTDSMTFTVAGSVDANATEISGDATAADNLEAMLDGTGGVTLSLEQIDIACDIANEGGIHVVNSNANGYGVAFEGAVAGLYSHGTNASSAGIFAEGGAYGGGPGYGIYASGDFGATYDGVTTGFQATGSSHGFLADGLSQGDIYFESKSEALEDYLTDIVADTNELQSDDVPGLIGALNDPTAASIADAVWDEATTGHTTAGTFGEQVKTDVDAILADTNEMQGDLTDGGRLDLLIDAILADTNELQGDDVPGLIAALNDPTAAEIATALLDLANGIETGWTLRQTLRVMAAALAGKLSGASTATNTLRDLTDTTDRIVATVDADGNRTAITLDGD